MKMVVVQISRVFLTRWESLDTNLLFTNDRNYSSQNSSGGHSTLASIRENPNWDGVGGTPPPFKLWFKYGWSPLQ